MGGIAVIFILGIYIFIAYKVVSLAKTKALKAVALVVMLLVPTADAIYGRIKLQQMCKAEGGIKVYKVVHNVEGFSDVDSVSDYWVKEQGYQFIESLPTNGSSTRYSRQNDQIILEEKVTPKSQYGVYIKKLGWINDAYMKNQYFVEAVATGEILATDTQIAFNGGWVERLIAMFSDAGGGAVAWCANIELDSVVRHRRLISKTLKH
ncbi:MAG: hypothetical protein ACXWT5_13415 [Methylophilus sp.]